MAKGRKQAYGRPKIAIPRSKSSSSRSSSFRSSPSPSSPTEPLTPKTPADEGIEFFQSQVLPGDPSISVYELKLDPDGGPSKELAVCIHSFVTDPWLGSYARSFINSIFGCLLHTLHTFYASQFKQALQPPRMASLRPISHWMEARLAEINSLRESKHS